MFIFIFAKFIVVTNDDILKLYTTTLCSLVICIVTGTVATFCELQFRSRKLIRSSIRHWL
uniref:Uncharacterized protein n=1 Tax=Arundo donax TaxID=35708 RepID=A0A0A9G6A2_ARUDO